MQGLFRSRLGRTIVLIAAVLIVVVVAITIQGNKAAAAASDRYSAARAELDAALQQARDQGYTTQDLEPIPERESQIESAAPPLLPSLRASFYDSQASQLDGLRAQLRDQEQTALDDARAAAASALQLGRDLLSQDDRMGVDPGQLQTLELQLTGLNKSHTSAKLPGDYWRVKQQADQLNAKAKQLAAAQSAENALLAEQAKQLEIQAQGRVDILRRDAGGAVFNGRNDASVASYLNIGILNGTYQQLEHYASLMQSANPDLVALGAAGSRHYADLVHRGLLAHLPHKAILVSLQAQELWAVQDGRVVLDSLVTTGRPQLPTDVGAMHVLFKSSPWTMKSPWPKTSPWWYPDTVVQMAIFFTDTGESLHDASWEPDGYYGAGSQYTSVASHGCIHVPYGNEQTLYGFSEVGTPVVVFPGDGGTVQAQMAQITVDASGQPFTGPKGV